MRRYQRRCQKVYANLRARIQIKVPFEVKKDFDALARKYRMSQAELGTFLFVHFLENKRLWIVAMRDYRRNKKQIIKDEFRSRANA